MFGLIAVLVGLSLTACRQVDDALCVKEGEDNLRANLGSTKEAIGKAEASPVVVPWAISESPIWKNGSALLTPEEWMWWQGTGWPNICAGNGEDIRVSGVLRGIEDAQAMRRSSLQA